MFFYEYREQKPLKGGPRCPTGRQGIVRVATVTGTIRHRDGRAEYADGTSADWCWEVPTGNDDAQGFVRREDVVRVLGHKPGSRLRGFNAGKGIQRLTDDQAAELMRLFKSGATPAT